MLGYGLFDEGKEYAYQTLVDNVHARKTHDIQGADERPEIFLDEKTPDCEQSAMTATRKPSFSEIFPKNHKKITNGCVAGGIDRLCFTQGDQESGGLRVKMGFSGRH
ncbi:MAG: hypothetical protein RI993_2189 [Pseudomonadota bacterium]|jgi:hypothetical protein